MSRLLLLCKILLERRACRVGVRSLSSLLPRLKFWAYNNEKRESRCYYYVETLMLWCGVFLTSRLRAIIRWLYDDLKMWRNMCANTTTVKRVEPVGRWTVYRRMKRWVILTSYQMYTTYSIGKALLVYAVPVFLRFHPTSNEGLLEVFQSNFVYYTY